MKKTLYCLAIFALLLTCCKTKSTTNETLQKLEESTMVINHTTVTEKNYNKNASDSIKVDTSFSAKYFKKWLKDTLLILNKNNIDTSRMQLSLSSDSLLLVITEFYSEKIPKKIPLNMPEDVELVISLLEECDELPKVDFKLSFSTRRFYEYSEAIPNWIDAQFDIDVIYVEYKNKIYNYNYNRVNLSLGDRSEFRVDKNGVEKFVDTIIFIWDQDGKLSKE